MKTNKKVKFNYFVYFTLKEEQKNMTTTEVSVITCDIFQGSDVP